jgi:catechol 2,3-dioxygenase-like lactoylglutathione lyase family enzyme
MKVRTLDHVNIRTERLEETLAFYTQVLGMTPRHAPGAAQEAPPTWLCDDDDRPVVHLGSFKARYPGDQELGKGVPARGGGAIDHVALECAGYDEMLDRIQAASLPLATNDIPQISLRQIFVQDPNGVTLELNFRAA